jgi:hypothetical protein
MRYFLTKAVDKNFITYSDSLNSIFKGYPGNIWVVDPKQADISNWIKKNNAVEKTKEEAQLIVDNEVKKAQDYWDSQDLKFRKYSSDIWKNIRELIEKKDAIDPLQTEQKEEAQLTIDNEVKKAQDYWSSLTEEEKRYNVDLISNIRPINIVIE